MEKLSCKKILPLKEKCKNKNIFSILFYLKPFI